MYLCVPRTNDEIALS